MLVGVCWFVARNTATTLRETMSLFITLPANGCVATSSRWGNTAHGSLVASWAGQSLAFKFVGTSLKLKTGLATERKDPNAGTPMIAIATGPTFEFSTIFDAQTFDPHAEDVLTLVASEKTLEIAVHLMLIDWAGIFELDSIITNSVNNIL